jgi:hypothetical protein
MIKALRIWGATIVFAALVGGSFMAVAAPSTSYAAECPAKDARVLGFPYWYRGLSETKGSGATASCEITSPGSGDTAVSDFIWKIALNIVEIAMVAVGYIAVGFIIYGGFKYITGAGASDKIVTGRKLILNAVIGLVISLFAVAIVNIVLRSFP